MDGQVDVYVNQHRFRLGDVNEALEDWPLYDICYVDPPWGQANLTRSYNLAQTRERLDWPNYVRALLSNLKDRAGQSSLLAIEVSKAQVKMFRDGLERLRFEPANVYQARYGKQPYFIMVGSFNESYPIPSIPSELPGMSFVKQFITQVVKKGHAFYDPCCGRVPEFTLLAASMGATCYGLEINQGKLNNLIQQLKGMISD